MVLATTRSATHKPHVWPNVRLITSLENAAVDFLVCQVCIVNFKLKGITLNTLSDFVKAMRCRKETDLSPTAACKYSLE